MKVHVGIVSRVFDVVDTARTARKPIDVGDACPVIPPKVFCVTSEIGGEMVNPSLTSKFWLFPNPEPESRPPRKACWAPINQIHRRWASRNTTLR